MQKSRIPMVVAIVQNVANLVASLLFVYALQWKVEGVAAGTVAGEYVGFALCFVIFRAKYHAALPGVELTEIMNRAAFTKFFNVNRDIFLRTLLHVAVMSWFTIRGERMDAKILAANALLMQLFVISGTETFRSMWSTSTASTRMRIFMLQTHSCVRERFFTVTNRNCVRKFRGKTNLSIIATQANNANLSRCRSAAGQNTGATWQSCSP